MNTSEISNVEQKTQTEISNSSGETMLFILKAIEYSFLAASVCSGVIAVIFPDEKRAVIVGAVCLAIFIFILLLNKQVFQSSRETAYQSDIAKKAELYNYQMSSNTSGYNSLAPAREKALRYSQELIEDYKKTRGLARNLYYTLQLGTIVLSGVTPILVLVDKLEAGQAWLEWLPVICPAIASIVASVVTSFPFQENTISANATVELLEAEQEKFILGVSPSYRCYDATDEAQQQQKAREAIENFIARVNDIHLKQIQPPEKVQSQKTEQVPAGESKPVES